MKERRPIATPTAVFVPNKSVEASAYDHGVLKITFPLFDQDATEIIPHTEASVTSTTLNNVKAKLFVVSISIFALMSN